MVRAERFAAVTEPPAGFSFYDITARDTPESLAAKFGRKHFQVGKGRSESCDFAQPLSGHDAPGAAVATFIRERGRDCCGVVRALPNQLATYVLGQGQPGRAGAMTGPITGTAVFSTVGGGLLTLTLRFSEQIEGYASAVTRHLGERYGQPLPGDGAAWARDGGLVTVSRSGAGPDRHDLFRRQHRTPRGPDQGIGRAQGPARPPARRTPGRGRYPIRGRGEMPPAAGGMIPPDPCNEGKGTDGALLACVGRWCGESQTWPCGVGAYEPPSQGSGGAHPPGGSRAEPWPPEAKASRHDTREQPGQQAVQQADQFPAQAAATGRGPEKFVSLGGQGPLRPWPGRLPATG